MQSPCSTKFDLHQIASISGRERQKQQTRSRRRRSRLLLQLSQNCQFYFSRNHSVNTRIKKEFQLPRHGIINEQMIFWGKINSSFPVKYLNSWSFCLKNGCPVILLHMHLKHRHRTTQIQKMQVRQKLRVQRAFKKQPRESDQICVN